MLRIGARHAFSYMEYNYDDKCYSETTYYHVVDAQEGMLVSVRDVDGKLKIINLTSPMLVSVTER